MSEPHQMSYLLSQYELLETVAKYLSTLDLYNLSLSCRGIYERILGSRAVFSQLKRLCLCDGHGLKIRQEFSGIYDLPDYIYRKPISDPVRQPSRTVYSLPSWAPPPPIQSAPFDQEIEVRVWNLKCDAVNALPCAQCGVNVCEVGVYLLWLSYNLRNGNVLCLGV
jgi:hypothetical protein